MNEYTRFDIFLLVRTHVRQNLLRLQACSQILLDYSGYTAQKKSNLCVLSGIALVEVLVSMGIMALLMPALITAFFAARGGGGQANTRLAAAAAVREGVEAVRVVRQADWANLADLAEGAPYHPEPAGGEWSLSPGEETVDPLLDLTRQVVVNPMYRDAGGSLSTTAGTLDPSVKRVTVSASWGLFEISEEFYLMRLTNLTWLETLYAEFEEGETNGTAVVQLDDGEIILGETGGAGDWCRPNDFIVEEVDLPQDGAARDVKGQEGQAFTGTNQSGTGSFVELGISSDDPPVASIVSQITGYQTNDVFVAGQYAYVATGDIGKDIVIIDLATNSEVGYFNDTAWFGTAQGIYVVGNVGYATIGLNLHTFDLSSKTGARPEMDRVFLWGTSYRLMVVGNYAYVALDLGSSELRLVNVANPNDIRLAAKANVNGARGQEVHVNETGTRAYLATSSSGSQDEFFIINTDVPASSKNSSGYNLTVINSYNANGMDPNGVAVVSGPRAIIVGTGGEEYQVLDITNESAIVRCGGMDVNTGIYGVSTVFTSNEMAYSYIVTGDNAAEFKIIEGGPGSGGGQYLLTGEYVSDALDAAGLGGSGESAFNRIEADIDNPASVTGARLQVAIGEEVDGSCEEGANNFAGPDGTDTTFFELEGLPEGEYSGTITGVLTWDDDGVGYENPARCLRYKAFLSTTDPSLTPILREVRINYSP